LREGFSKATLSCIVSGAATDARKRSLAHSDSHDWFIWSGHVLADEFSYAM
jgi:hypothetical protein